jgi:anti-anti-sigma factor
MELETIHQDDRLTHVLLSGRLDTAAAREFEPEFLAQAVAPGKPLLADLAGLTFLSSMGIRMLLSAAIELNKKGSKVALLNMPPLAAKAVRDSGLDMVMSVAGDYEEAVRLLL